MASLQFRGEDGYLYEVPAIRVNEYYSEIITGDGTKNMSLEVPFNPDIITIQCMNATEAYNGTYIMLTANFYANEQSGYDGFATMAKTGATSTRKHTQEPNNYSITTSDNGTINISDILFGTSNQYTGVWGENLKYAVFCKKI